MGFLKRVSSRQPKKPVSPGHAQTSGEQVAAGRYWAAAVAADRERRAATDKHP